MGEPIGRDVAVAGVALRYALVTDVFTTEEILAAMADPPGSEDVVRALRELVRAGWLARSEDDPTLWTAGPRAIRLRCEEVPLSRGHLCEDSEVY
jgi:hypothetical protein